MAVITQSGFNYSFASKKSRLMLCAAKYSKHSFKRTLHELLKNQFSKRKKATQLLLFKICKNKRENIVNIFIDKPNCSLRVFGRRAGGGGGRLRVRGLFIQRNAFLNSLPFREREREKKNKISGREIYLKTYKYLHWQAECVRRAARGF